MLIFLAICGGIYAGIFWLMINLGFVAGMAALGVIFSLLFAIHCSVTKDEV
jgi:hypothetical protein